MNDGRIKEFMHRVPFAPFDIRTSDGRAYTVDHPDFIARARGGKVIVFFTEDDRAIMIDVSHIVSLEVANRPSGSLLFVWHCGAAFQAAKAG